MFGSGGMGCEVMAPLTPRRSSKTSLNSSNTYKQNFRERAHAEARRATANPLLVGALHPRRESVDLGRVIVSNGGHLLLRADIHKLRQ